MNLIRIKVIHKKYSDLEAGYYYFDNINTLTYYLKKLVGLDFKITEIRSEKEMNDEDLFLIFCALFEHEKDVKDIYFEINHIKKELYAYSNDK